MVMRQISLCLLLSHLQAAVGSACVPVECLRCNVTEDAQLDIPSNCTKDFQVSVNSNGSTVQEGSDITLTCVHNLPSCNLTFQWKRNREEHPENKSELALKNVLSRDGGQYVCVVKSPCGIYESSPHDVTVSSNSELLLVICGVAALVLVVSMGLAMKFKLKRDNAKHKERMNQRAQAGQRNGPAPLTPRES